MEEYLSLGKIIDTFSLDGSVKILSSTTNQEIRYKKGNKVLLKDGDNLITLTVSSYRSSASFDIVKFEEINNIDEAIQYKGKELVIIKDQNDLEEGYYFYSDLEGCEIVADDKVIGKVISVEEFPAQVTLRGKSSEGKYFYVPFVKAFIKKVDITNKRIDINYIEGLL